MSHGWRSRRRARPPGAGAQAALATLAAAAQPALGLGLTAAVRRIARKRPEAFARLGEARAAVFLLAPDELPFAFSVVPDGERSRVGIVAKRAETPFRTRVAGPLAVLLDLFDGGADADAAFFARSVRVEGDTAALMALHNALEAAELRLSDLLPLPAPARRMAGAAYDAVRRLRPATGAPG